MLEYWGQILTRPQLSLSLLLMLTREARKETSFPLSPSHRPLRTIAVIVSRNRSLTAYKIIRDDWGRVSGQIKLEPHPIEGLNSNFPTYGHGFFVTTIPSPEIYFSGSTEIFSSTFQIKRNSFLLWR